MTVWHSDMFGRNDFLGELMLPLQGQIFDDPTPRWYGLQDRVRTIQRAAEGRLTVTKKAAHKLILPSN